MTIHIYRSKQTKEYEYVYPVYQKLYYTKDITGYISNNIFFRRDTILLIEVMNNYKHRFYIL